MTNFISVIKDKTAFDGTKKDMKEIKKVSKELSDQLIQMVRDTIEKIQNDKESQEVSNEVIEAWEYVKHSIKAGGESIRIERRQHIFLFFIILIVVIATAVGSGYWLWRAGYLNFANPLLNWIKSLLRL